MRCSRSPWSTTRASSCCACRASSSPPARCSRASRRPGAVEALAPGIDDALSLGAHPTQVQDILFSVNQLAEIATRALSPGTNDPNTAIMCIDRLNQGLCRLAGRPFPPHWRADDAGRARLWAKAPSFADVLHAAFAQIRRYGRQDAQVLTRLLESIGDIASCGGEAARAELLRHADLVLAESRGAERAGGTRAGGRAARTRPSRAGVTGANAGTILALPVDHTKMTENAPGLRVATAHPPVAPGSAVTTAIMVLIAVVALYFGREILVPFALAILLGFILAPPVDWLRRVRVPRVLAVGLVVTPACGLLGALSLLVGSQLVQLAGNLPEYQQTMQDKIRACALPYRQGRRVDRTAAVFQSLRSARSEPAPVPSARPRRTGETPVRVQVDPPSQQPLEVIGRVLAPLMGPLGTAGLVIVFVIFMLLERNDLRDRFIRLAGGGLHRTTGALNEAAQRVSRYLVMQLIVNAAYGVPIGVGLYFIGVPNAMLWGLLAALLRFVPYLGPFIAALFPLALAFAVDPGWSMLLWTLALIIGMELVSNNVVEPWLYGSSTGLSPVAIIIAAMFWTLIWGPVGLILATPLTVCLAIMGRYVPRLEFLEVMLGSSPVLTPQEQLYQRLLAGNAEEAIELAETLVGESALLEFYDGVALPALSLAERDRDRRLVDRGPQAHRRRRAGDGRRARRRRAGRGRGARCSASPGAGSSMAAAAAMFAHLLRERGIGARRSRRSSDSARCDRRARSRGCRSSCACRISILRRIPMHASSAGGSAAASRS